MKILLIYPYCLEQRVIDHDIKAVPIGLYYVGALLRERGMDVEILNWHDIDKTPKMIEAVLAEKQPDIIGFSILHANRWGGIEIARVAKHLNPDIKIIFGGVGATFLWKHLLSNFLDIDFVVLGEGEYTFLHLVEAIDRGHLSFDDLKEIKGIAFRKDMQVFKTEDAGYINDIDALPNPALYFTFEHVISSRGCPWNCTFCGSPSFWKRKVRFHSPEYFVDQLALLYEKGVRFFYFSDDTFTINRDRVIDICKKILARGLDIRWVAISRVNYVHEEALYWMRRAGCIQISYGVESGSNKIRDLLNKNIGLEEIKRAFALTVSYGILARAYFIYGCPGETWQTIRETSKLINEIKPLSTIFYILDLFPGTKLYEKFVQQTKITDDIWLNRIEDIMYFETDPRLTSEDILAFGRYLRTEFYRNLHNYAASIKLRDDPALYPLHADFLSRLAMTFSHGDYSKIDEIKDKECIAESLFERALDYCPDHRAFLGLAIIRQKQGDMEGAARVASEGLKHFPDSEDLNICMGISCMNLGRYEEALAYFLPFQGTGRYAVYMDACYKGMGRI